MNSVVTTFDQSGDSELQEEIIKLDAESYLAILNCQFFFVFFSESNAFKGTEVPTNVKDYKFVELNQYEDFHLKRKKLEISTELPNVSL